MKLLRRLAPALGLFAALSVAFFPPVALAAVDSTAVSQLKGAARVTANPDEWSTAFDSLGKLTGTNTQTVWVPASSMAGTVATDSWVFSVSSNLPRKTLTATGANALTWGCAIPVPNSVDGAQGYKLTSFTVHQTIGTLALTSSTCVLQEITTTTAPPTAAARAITVTMPTATGSANTVATVDVPFYIDGDAKAYEVTGVVTPQNTSTWALYGILFTFSRT